MYRSQRTRRIGASLLLFLALQGSGLPVLQGVAWATAPSTATVPRVVLFPVLPGTGVTERSAQKLTSLLRDELEGRRDELELVSTPTDKDAKTSATISAAGMLEEGKRALSSLELDVAATQLRKGIDAAWADPGAVTAKALAEAYVDLAVAEFRRGEERAAKAALGSVVRLDPKFQLPDGRFPPVFARELEKARKASERQPKGSITVEGPPGATATVDVVEIGMVPEVQEGLAPGQHLVRVETTSREVTATAVEVKGNAVKVKAPFGPALTPPPPSMPALSFRGSLDVALAAELSMRLKAVDAEVAVLPILQRGQGDTELKVVAALYSRKRQGFVLLTPVGLGADLVTANVEVYKLGAEIQRNVRTFGALIALPHMLLPPTPVAAAPAPSSRPATSDAPTATASRGPLKPTDAPAVAPAAPKPLAAATVPAPAPAPKVTSKSPPLLAPLVPVAEPSAAPAQNVAMAYEKQGGIPWWVWALGTAGVVAVAGGTYYGVSQATRPVTGTVTARW
jgi:hypothetical protein